MFRRLHRAFPDLHITVEDVVAEGKSINYDEIFIFRMASGRIVESGGVVDVLSQLRQLGAIGQIPS